MNWFQHHNHRTAMRSLAQLLSYMLKGLRLSRREVELECQMALEQADGDDKELA